MIHFSKPGFLLSAIIVSHTLVAQQTKTAVQSFPAAKAAEYTKVSGLPYAYKTEQYGATELILRYTGTTGKFSFVLNRKPVTMTRYIDYEDGAVSEQYDYTTHKWIPEAGSHRHSDMKGKAVDTTILREDQLYAFVLQEQANGQIIERIQFRDFGNVVYWPDYVFDLCTIADADKDGKPEFYLTYFADSDGLDAKELKQIVYTLPSSAADKLVKAKATAYYPVDTGDENDPQVYHEIFDNNWSALPKAVQQKSKSLIQTYKKRKLYQ